MGQSEASARVRKAPSRIDTRKDVQLNGTNITHPMAESRLGQSYLTLAPMAKELLSTYGGHHDTGQP